MGSSVSSRRSGKRISSARLQQSAGRQQVAAVCYRIGSLGLEFLLVQTRGGRWIFPKGGVEPGLTQAQSAALEAFEEAGVHGRIEEMPFARYLVSKSGRQSGNNSRKVAYATAGTSAVTAHLCEVSHLETPQEANRRPTWFSPEKAKRRLLEDRAAEFGEELAGVVDRAVSRIRRLEVGHNNQIQKDPLQKVRFEAFDHLHLQGTDAALLRFLRQHRPLRFAAPLQVEGQAAALPRLPQLGAGPRPVADTAQKIAATGGAHAKFSLVKSGRRRAHRN